MVRRRACPSCRLAAKCPLGRAQRSVPPRPRRRRQTSWPPRALGLAWPQRCTSRRQTCVAIAAARAAQTKL
eukprot:3790968-Pyramimonas_sp.AAC.1